MNKMYYGRGKLMLSGEYAVLDGAESLALPTRLGQTLWVEKKEKKAHLLINWLALLPQKNIWMHVQLNDQMCNLLEDSPDTDRLIHIVRQLQHLNPAIFNTQYTYNITTKIEFDPSWGLGSSSTLIYTLAKWAGVDAYELLNLTFGGSGYDIACAQSNHPLIYKRVLSPIEKRQIRTVSFEPIFKQHLYFAYIGKKKNSREGIKHYQKQSFEKDTFVKQISAITNKMLSDNTLNDFEESLITHEKIIAHTLQLERIQHTLFKDYWGVVKSLGAWGGDFVMLTNTKTKDDLVTYLRNKDIHVWFSFDDIFYIDK